MRPLFICSHSSLKVDEPLPGTAPRGDVWMLLEYDGVWGEKAFKESQLPEPVKAHLDNLLDRIPFSKLLLIRQHLARRVERSESRISISPKREGIRFYLALAAEQEPLLYAFLLGKYEDLLDLDILGAAQRTGKHQANLSQQALTLICTNGRRDWCCAHYGTGIYQAIARANQTSADPLEIWQSTHLGGHRFAPNLACFPEGHFYGRIEEAELQIFLDHIRQGQVYPAKARGRACYPAPIQAAEVYLRQKTGLNKPHDLQLIDAVESQPDEWVVQFRSLQDGATHTLEIVREETSDQIYKSCNDPDTTPVVVYRLVDS